METDNKDWNEGEKKNPIITYRRLLIITLKLRIMFIKRALK